MEHEESVNPTNDMSRCSELGTFLLCARAVAEQHVVIGSADPDKFIKNQSKSLFTTVFIGKDSGVG